MAAGSVLVSVHPTRPFLKWLGVLFDRKLTFKWHVQELSTKASRVSNALKSLGNTERGVPASLIRQAVTSCVLPIAYYAAETWWPGRARPGRLGNVSNRVDSLVRLLDKVVLSGARAILPVYRTTPNPALFREAGLPPSELKLDNIALSSTARLRRLDRRHPLRLRADKIARTGNSSTRLARRVLSLPPSEEIDPLRLPPWH